MSKMEDAPPNKLEQMFATVPHAEHASRWNALYAEQFTPWDRGGPSPALEDLLSTWAELQPASSAGRRRTALVPGCGQGHDVLLLSAFGYDVYGLDYAPLVREAALRNQAATTDDERYRAKPGVVDGKGKVKFLLGDFFADEWVDEAGVEGGVFDLIFDYTFLCAMPPDVRPRWAKRMSQLLSPDGGRLVCLEFPSGKPVTEPGPPWGLQPETYLALLTRPGEEVEYDAEGKVVYDTAMTPGAGALKRLSWSRPPRTHPSGMDEQGRVVDGLSVWSH